MNINMQNVSVLEVNLIYPFSHCNYLETKLILQSEIHDGLICVDQAKIYLARSLAIQELNFKNIAKIVLKGGWNLQKRSITFGLGQ